MTSPCLGFYPIKCESFCFLAEADRWALANRFKMNIKQILILLGSAVVLSIFALATTRGSGIHSAEILRVAIMGGILAICAGSLAWVFRDRLD